MSSDLGRWLARHRNVHFHYTPTHASWPNQVEIWFSILKRAALDGASHTSPRQVRGAIDRFVSVYNKTATPFEWQKREVHQVDLSTHHADLRNQVLGSIISVRPSNTGMTVAPSQERDGSRWMLGEATGLETQPTDASGPPPYVSVVVATLNQAATLQACLDSVIEQTFPRWELIVIDGASEDGTVDIIQEYDAYLHYWISEPDSGVYGAWNKALSHARGTWVQFLGADDRLAGPDVFERAVRVLRDAEHRFSVVYGAIRVMDARGDLVRVLGEPWQDARHKFRDLMSIPHPATFHHRSLFGRAGRFDETFRIAGDYEFLLRVLLRENALFIPDLVVADWKLGGLSSQPANSDRTECEVERARRMHGLPRHYHGIGLAQYLRFRVKLMVARVVGPHAADAVARCYRWARTHLHPRGR